jgi:putative flippase GtrA
VAAYIFAITFSYFATSRYVFQKRENSSTLQTISIYIIFIAFSALVQATVTTVIFAMLKQQHVSWLIGAGLAAALNFYGLRVFVFTTRPPIHQKNTEPNHAADQD